MPLCFACSTNGNASVAEGGETAAENGGVVREVPLVGLLGFTIYTLLNFIPV